MKTLSISTDGLIEFSVNGVSFNTDVEDVHISAWAKNAINQIIDQLQLSGSHYVHFEDTGYVTFYHKKRMGVVQDWTDPIPDVFTNLERMHGEYTASVEAAMSVEVSDGN